MFDSNTLEVLQNELPKISNWREHQTANGLVYGQKFLSIAEARERFTEFEFVPKLNFEIGDMSHETILANLHKFAATTKAALSDNALKKVEGVILRNADRTKIVKVRFEDYERTLKHK